MRRFMLALLTLFVPFSYASTVGSLPGELLVDSGAAMYQIPLQLPEGRGGNTPQLSISYSSQGSGYSALGPGFSLSGLSAITRCGSTISTDGFKRSPNYTHEDNFCLDGSRLISVSGQRGKSGSSYKTEIDQYSQITLSGDSLGTSSQFIVKTKSGDVLTYKNDSDNLVWLLAESTDTTKKNVIRYSYTNNNLIRQIVYDAYTVGFTYQANTSSLQNGLISKVNGKVKSQYEKLSKVSIAINGKVKNYYNLSYTGAEFSTNTPTRLASVQYCSANGTCLPKTNFHWNGNSAYSLNRSLAIKVPNWSTGGLSDGAWVDVDADKKLDYCQKYSRITTDSVSALNPKRIDCRLGNESTFTHTFKYKDASESWWLDINNDGKTEYCALSGSNLYCSNFSASGVSSFSIHIGSWGTDKNRRWWIDLNGDNRIDFCRSDGSLLRCSINKDGRSFYEKKFNISDWGDIKRTWWADIDGNGFPDYCRSVRDSGNGGTLRCDLFNGDRISATKDIHIDDWGYDDRRWWTDINGDGASDYCRAVGDKSGANSRLRCSLGSVGKVSDLKTGFEVANFDWGYSDKRWWVDLNKDGKQDYCRAVGDHPNTYMRCSSMKSGSSWVDYTYKVGDWGYRDKNWFVDTNSDGNVEYCRHVGDKSGTNSYIRCSENTTIKPSLNLFTGVTNGLGHHSSVSFTTLFDGQVYHKNALYPGDKRKLNYQFPKLNAYGPMYIVKQLKSENGAGSNRFNTYDFTYGSASYDLLGHGFSGFKWIQQTEKNDGQLTRVRETYYNTEFPLNGTVKESREYFGNKSVLLNKSITEFSNSISLTASHYEQQIAETVSLTPVFGKVELLSTAETHKYEMYHVNGKDYLKAPDKFIPIHGDIMIPVVIPSHEYYEFSKAGVYSYDKNGNPTHFASVKGLSAAEIEKLRPLMHGPSDATYVISASGTASNGHGYQTLTKTVNKVSTARVYQVEQKKTTEQSYDLNSQLVSTVITEHADIDKFGNVGKVTVSTTAKNPLTQTNETFTKQTKSIFKNDIAKWHLGRLLESEVVHTDAKGETEVRKASFEYDSTTGLLIKEVSAAGSPLALTTTYTRNDEGVVESSHITGFAGNGGISQRSSSVKKTYAGDFVNVINTNTLGQSSTQIINRYNNSVIVKDSNGLVAATYYDDFGREVKKEVLKGTAAQLSTSVQYLPASHSQCSSLKPNNQIVYCVVTQSDGGGEAKQFFDKFKREWRTATLAVGGKRWIIKDTFYNAKNQIVKVSRPYYQGDTPQYSNTIYDALGRIQSVSEPGPAGKGDVYASYVYEPLKVTETDALGRKKTTFTNAMGWVIQVDQPLSASVKNQYTPTGNLSMATGAGGATIVNTYDDLGNKTSTRDPDLGFWQYEYDSFGNLLKQTDAKGQSVVMQYDALNRMVKRVDEKLIVENQQPKSQFTESKWYYDSYGGETWQGALIRSEAPGYLKKLSYTSYGQLRKEEIFTADHTFAREFDYDKFGRVVKDVRPNNFTLEHEYDAVTGALTGVYGAPSQFKLDFNPAEYNQVIKPLLAEALAKASDYVNKSKELQNQAITYNRRREEFNSLLDQVKNVSGGTSEIYNQVNHKTLTVYRDSAGDIYLEVPDNFILIHNDVSIPIITPPSYHLKLVDGQLSKVSLADWTSKVSSLEATGESAFFGDYNNDGVYDLTRLAISKAMPQIYDSLVSKYFQRLNQLASEIQRLEYVEDHTRMQATTYAAAAAQLVTLTKQTLLVASRYENLSEQNQVQYEQLTDLTEQHINKNRVYYWKLNSLDAEGRITAESYGNGLFNQYDYNEGNGQLQNISTHQGKKAKRLLHYRYDAMDNVTLREDIMTGISETYTYDALDRLKTNKIIDTIGANRDNPLFNKTYSVDYGVNGNITYKSDVGHYAYQDKQHVHAVTSAGERTYQYDLNGNMLEGDGRVFEWSSFNKPTKITRGDSWAAFSYGPDRARYLKTNHKGDKTWYLGKAYERIDYSNGDVEHKQFINAGGKLVALNIDKKTTKNGTEASIDRQLRYFHNDALGSADLITDIWGNVVDRRNFDAWGKERDFVWETDKSFVQQALMTNRGYTGHEQVDEVDLIHMNGRMYDATLGRFVSADTFIQAPSNSQSFNRYSYVLNNPMKYNDPSGHFFKKLFKEIGRFLDKYAVTIIQIGLIALASMAGPWAGAAMAGVLGYAQGGVRGALTSIATSLMFMGIGNAFGTAKVAFGNAAWAAKTLAHGVAGGISSVMSGGKFGDGFWSAALTQAFAPSIDTMMPGESGVALMGRVAIAAVVGGTGSKLSGGKFENGAVTGAFSRLFNHEMHPAQKAISRKQCVLNGGGCNFGVAENPNADGSMPWYEIGSLSPVDDYALTIQMSANAFGIDPKLISSIMFMETTHGYYDVILSPFGMNKSILPMNINIDYWGDAFGSRGFLSNPHHNIWAGAKMLSSIIENMPNASVAQIATVYNNVNATKVSDYGARVSAIYSGN
ncbi:RHS repeat-associated core domain-containing protein [Photobacterium sp. 2_MG-2023]|uniref:RHS repeat-associated core domain-containing protein n=1 Tax=Photobacterium sp. 2_MG-2023 TaxID=3062663 RepID=UPI0026E2DC80|nr:RHS repeat-associated core domain-containing protein [Photobacterium sp. 2_MG-2023]MDO6581317.1 RHS repeat-associated core domain-containing protein [Photobacterium sp. 2_MG-2023]